MVLVDTSVWSLALRRQPLDLSPPEKGIVAVWSELVRQGRVRLLGPIRQEILSGLRDAEQFTALRERLAAFPDAPIEAGDYVQAARFFNLCRGRGVAGSHTDMLICAVGHRFHWPVFSVDADFARYAKLLPIRLHGSG
jgi:predicted nucleic acid-binding protein